MNVAADDPRSFDMALGHTIRAMRSELAITQQSFAARTRLTQEQIKRYEEGAIRIAPAHLIAVARALGRKVVDLVGEALEGKLPHAKYKDVSELLRAYGEMGAPRQRIALMSFARELAVEESKRGVS